MARKPLGRKAYGSIGHLPNSRLGPKDRCITDGQARIATRIPRDRHDRVIVQEKLDGSCVAAVRIDGEIVSLGRAGYTAESSPHEQHWLFAQWVKRHEKRFLSTLEDGERIVGEWLAQAHGTRYYGLGAAYEPFVAFDIMRGTERLPFEVMRDRVGGDFALPSCLHYGAPISVDEAMERHRLRGVPCDGPEGVVYRVERKGKVDFLCKWVRPDKIDGKYLPEISGQPAVWNWRP